MNIFIFLFSLYLFFSTSLESSFFWTIANKNKSNDVNRNFPVNASVFEGQLNDNSRNLISHNPIPIMQVQPFQSHLKIEQIIKTSTSGKCYNCTVQTVISEECSPSESFKEGFIQGVSLFEKEMLAKQNIKLIHNDDFVDKKLLEKIKKDQYDKGYHDANLYHIEQEKTVFLSAGCVIGGLILYLQANYKKREF
ncbi:MAG: hypothetical protein ACXWL5_01015 [Candidatus Chromulinivorax sp.]